MNGLPDPYGMGRHLIVNGNTVVVVDRAPNADGWRYIGARADLSGPEVHFSHEEARPVEPARVSIGPLLNEALGRASIDPVVFDAEIRTMQAENIEPTLTPLQELLSVIEHVARNGHLELRQALNIYREATS